MSSYLIRNLSSTRYSNANSCLYDLAAVIVHHGNGMGSGMIEWRRECFLHNHWFVQDTTLHLRRTARPGLTSTTWMWRRRIGRMCRAPRPTSCSTSRGTSTEPWTAETGGGWDRPALMRLFSSFLQFELLLYIQSMPAGEGITLLSNICSHRCLQSWLKNGFLLFLYITDVILCNDVDVEWNQNARIKFQIMRPNAN